MTITPPESPRLRARYDRRRRQVVDRSAEAFAVQGYHNLSMPALAQESGLTAGGLYHYIGTKDDLLHAIFERISGETMVAAQAALHSGAPPAERLRGFVEVWVELLRRFHAHHRTFVQERPSIELGPHGEAVRAWRDEFRDVLDELLEGVRREGRLRIEDRRLAVATLQGMVTGVSLRAHEWLADASAAEIADAVCRLVLKD